MEKETEILSPMRAIKAKCLDCACGQREEVKLCPVKDCPLYPYRMGKNPNRKRTLTDEQKRAAAERLAKARATRNSK